MHKGRTRLVHVLDVGRYSLVRVVWLACDLDLVEGPVLEVALGEVLCHPVAPFQREPVLVVAAEDKDRNANHEGAQPFEEHLGEAVCVLL